MKLNINFYGRQFPVAQRKRKICCCGGNSRPSRESGINIRCNCKVLLQANPLRNIARAAVCRVFIKICKYARAFANTRDPEARGEQLPRISFAFRLARASLRLSPINPFFIALANRGELRWTTKRGNTCVSSAKGVSAAADPGGSGLSGRSE